MSPKSRGRPRSEAAHAAILNGALALLEEGGLPNVTVEAVAVRAGVGKPTIYRYWANAQELSMAALMAHSPEVVEQPESACPFESLRQQLRSVIERFATPAGRQAALLMANASVDSELSKAFRNQVILKGREEGRRLLESAIDTEKLQLPCSLDSVLDMAYGPIFYRLLVGHQPLEKSLADDVVELLQQSCD